jgi:hypothetical protein
MGKRIGGKAKLLASASAVRLPDVIAQASLTPEQAARFDHVVSKVSNPLGEVTIAGDIRQHKACRRVPQFETLWRAKVIDDAAFIVLGWYWRRLGKGGSGLFKSCLDMTGGRAVHTPSGIDARDDIDWARSFVRPGLLPVLDGVMADEESFADVARRLYPALATGWAQRRVSAEFKEAVALLCAGVGNRIRLENAA